MTSFPKQQNPTLQPKGEFYHKNCLKNDSTSNNSIPLFYLRLNSSNFSPSYKVHSNLGVCLWLMFTNQKLVREFTVIVIKALISLQQVTQSSRQCLEGSTFSKKS